MRFKGTPHVADEFHAPVPATKPPGSWDTHQYHWLDSERSSSPTMSEWLGGQWHSAGEVKPITPEEMYRRGWRWYAPAIPPENSNAN